MTRFVATACLSMMGFWATGQGISFFEGTFDEAKKKAAAESKLIFVDAYTAWCGPCKRMSKNVFPQANVGTYFNRNFINLKLNMEKGEGRKFARQYRVTAYPTLFFLDGEGKAAHRVVGGRDASGLLKEGQKAMDKAGLTDKMDQRYNDGDRTPGFLYEYALARHSAGQEYDEIFIEYLATQPREELSSEKNAQLMMLLTDDIRSPGASVLEEMQASFEERFGEEAMEVKWREVIAASLEPCLKNKDEECFKEVQSYAKRVGTADQVLQNEVRFSRSVGDYDRFYSTAKSWVKKYHKKDAAVLASTAMQFQSHFDDPKRLKVALAWAQAAVELQPNYYNYNAYAHVLFKTGLTKEAKEAAEKAVQLAAKERKNPKRAKALLRQIQ